MRAGALDRQITVEKKQVTQDATYGTEVITWVPLAMQAGSPAIAARFAAQVLDIMPSKSEALQSGLAVSRNLIRIRLRYRNDIDSSMRVIVHGDSERTLQIVGGPAMLGRKETMEIVCEEFSS